MTARFWFILPTPPSGDDTQGPRLDVSRQHEAAVPSDGDASEALLVSRIRDGDEEAFAELFRTYYPRLVGYAASLLGDTDDAKEIICDLFARIYVSRATWSPSGRVRAYLFRAARNRALNVRRDRQTASRVAIAAEEERRHEHDEANTASQDTQDIAALVDAVIAELPPRAREAASLRWRQGMSLDEIAHTMGIAKTSVAMLLSRTLKQLRERVSARGCI